MKTLIPALIALTIGAPAFAGTLQIPVVTSYDRLEDPKLWSGIAEDEVPLDAIEYREIAVPSRATSKIYLQNERMMVCYETCEKEQPELRVSNGKIKLGNLDANKFLSGHKRDEAWKALKMLNVYFWTNQLFDRLESLGYKPSRHLKVIIEREISDPTSGKGFMNNAFFYDKDWSLNFLPIKNNILFKMLGMNLRSPALDSSVAIHECAHSVFQDLIGNILNPGIYGLHEALADYFTMSLLETRKIGTIMSSGSPFRSTLDDNEKEKTIYKPGMEAHDSGNIVNTALQHIRALSKDKTFFDAVALKTLRSLGQSPYILPTHIQSAYMNSLKQTALEKNWPLSEELSAKISGIWKTYNIQAPQNMGPLPPSYFTQAENTAGYFEVTTIKALNSDIAEQWSLPVTTQMRSRILKTLEGPLLQIPGKKEADVTTVIYAETQINDKTTPLWAQISKEGVLGSYDQNGNLIQSNNPLFADVLHLSEHLKSITELLSHNDLGLMIGGLFEGSRLPTESPFRRILKAQNQSLHVGSMTTSSLGKVAVHQRSARLKTTLLGKGLNWLIGGPLASFDTITIYTTIAKSYPQLKTTELFEGERYLGYEIHLKNGSRIKIYISDFDADPRSTVLPTPKTVLLK